MAAANEAQSDEVTMNSPACQSSWAKPMPRVCVLPPAQIALPSN